MSFELLQSEPMTSFNLTKDGLSIRIKDVIAEMPINDFLDGVRYVLTGSDLESYDLRIRFIEWAKKVQITEGFDKDKKRLEVKDEENGV